MKILALDTASDACSAALDVDGVVLARRIVEPRAHARVLLPMVRGLLDESGLELARLDALAFGRGPGAFTGVRIAAAAVQGLAFGSGLPVVPVSDLQALAQGARDRDGAKRVAVAVDARMGEVYWGLFTEYQDLMVHAGEEMVVSPDRIAAPPAGPWLGVGTGWRAHRETLGRHFGADLQGPDADRLPAATDMIPIARAAVSAGDVRPPGEAVPLYLRDRVAWTRAPR